MKVELVSPIKDFVFPMNEMRENSFAIVVSGTTPGLVVYRALGSTNRWETHYGPFFFIGDHTHTTIASAPSYKVRDLRPDEKIEITGQCHSNFEETRK